MSKRSPLNPNNPLTKGPPSTSSETADAELSESDIAIFELGSALVGEQSAVGEFVADVIRGTVDELEVLQAFLEDTDEGGAFGDLILGTIKRVRKRLSVALEHGAEVERVLQAHEEHCARRASAH